MNETMQQIHKLAEERFDLYRQAGNGGLNQVGRDRIKQITDRLPILWDQYRRELASTHAPRTSITRLPENRAA